MAVLEIRQRTGWLFAVVIVGHLILISAQAQTGSGVPILETLVFGVFARVQGAATSAVATVQHTWQDYFALQQIRRENEALKAEVAQLRIGLQSERTVAGQSRELQDLLELRREFPLATIAARVIGGGASPEFRTMTIDKGTEDGLRPDMAVIAPAGVVGRIIQPSRRAAKVQLLIDSDAAAGALVERTRVQGVVVGIKNALRLDHVSSSADIKLGDRIVTSGIEGIFPPPPAIDGKYPRGFVIGHIESLDRRPDNYENVIVRPAVDFSSLETVLVVLRRPTGDVMDAAFGTERNVVSGNEGR